MVIGSNTTILTIGFSFVVGFRFLSFVSGFLHDRNLGLLVERVEKRKISKANEGCRELFDKSFLRARNSQFIYWLWFRMRDKNGIRESGGLSS